MIVTVRYLWAIRRMLPVMDLHVVTGGEGPAILFVHAGVADSRMWRDQLDAFAATHRVIAFDKRGFGETPWTPGPYSDTADSVAVLDQEGVKSAVVVGCSMGGATALDMAIEHPDRVDGLVLVGAIPNGWVPPDGWDENPREAEAAAAYEEGDYERVVEIDYQMWLVGYDRSADEIDPRVRDLFMEMDRVPVPTEADRNKHQMGFERNLNDHLDAISVPTLVVVGAHDEPLLIEAAHYLAERLSDRPAIVIEHAAHLPSLEQPDAFNRVLGDFLGQ